MSQLSQKLRDLRKGRKLTLAQLSGQVFIDVAILSKIERGERKISKTIVQKLATFYGVDPEPLIVSALNEQLLQQYGQDELGQQAIIAAEQEIAYRTKQNAKQASLPSRSTIIKTAKKYFESQKRVSHAWLFGSFARGEASENSDIDIIIDVPRSITFTLFDLAEVQERLEEVFKRKVDVLMIGGLRPAMTDRVKSEMMPIYGKI